MERSGREVSRLLKRAGALLHRLPRVEIPVQKQRLEVHDVPNNDDKFGGIGASCGVAGANAGCSTKRSPIAVARYELRPEHRTSPVVAN